MSIAEEDILQLQFPQQIWISNEDYNIAEARFICHMEHSQSLSLDPIIQFALYKSDYIWLSSPTLYTNARSLCFEMIST